MDDTSTIVQGNYSHYRVRSRRRRIRSIGLTSNSFSGYYFYPEVSRSKLNVKRFIDFIGALLGLFSMAVLYPFIVIAIKKSSPGPVIFKQKRRGENGDSFTCLKFRTMHMGLDNEDGLNSAPNITQEGDPRVFAVGRFLRKTNLDEIPQFINVLKGDMSLVGPRPLMVEECEYWQKRIPGFDLRHYMKPGITGWAQVTGYRGGSLDAKHMMYRVKRDLKYIEQYSPALDMKIIFRTISQMISLNTKAH